MITALNLSSRQLMTLFGLGLGAFIELICAILVLKRDPKYRGNQLTALAYLTMSIGVLINVIYVLIDESDLVALLHRFTNFFVIIGASFLFLAALFIAKGSWALKSYYMILPILMVISGLSLFLLNDGVIVFVGDSALPETEQFIEWTPLFFTAAAIPIYIMVLSSLYFYYGILKDIPSDVPSEKSIRQAFLLISGGILLLGICHFFLVVPHLLRNVLDIGTLVLIGNLGSAGVLLGSILIFLGFRTRVSEKSTFDNSN